MTRLSHAFACVILASGAGVMAGLAVAYGDLTGLRVGSMLACVALAYVALGHATAAIRSGEEW